MDNLDNGNTQLLYLDDLSEESEAILLDVVKGLENPETCEKYKKFLTELFRFFECKTG